MRPEWWPTPDGEPIGEERARELVAYIRETVPPAIDLARAYLQGLRPGGEIQMSAQSARQLATESLDAAMTGVCIGLVSSGAGGLSIAVPVVLLRTGRIGVRLSPPSDPVQRWAIV